MEALSWCLFLIRGSVTVRRRGAVILVSCLGQLGVIRALWSRLSTGEVDDAVPSWQG